MHRIIYHSKALIGADLGQVEAIIARSIEWNGKHGITGMLWFDGNNFAQVLEGDAVATHVLLDNIRADRRHTDVTVILDRPVQSRMFGQWAMMRADDSDACSSHHAFMVGFSRQKTPAFERLHEIVLAGEGYAA